MPIVSDFTALLYDADAQRINGMTAAGTPVFITYSFLKGTDLPAPSEVSYSPTSVHGFTADQELAFRDAVTKAEVVAGIRFIEVDDPNDATIQVYNVQGTQWLGFAATPWVNTWSTYSGNLAINPSSPTDDFTSGTSWYEVILHELGHAIGLDHPFEGANTLETSLDNDDNSLMSYTSNGVNDTAFAPLDVQALQYLYGTGSNLDPAVSWSWDTTARLFTLIGSANDDTLISTNTASVMNGGEGADLLIGRDGDDQLSGGNGADQLQLSSGTDIMNLGSGADEIIWWGSFEGETTVSDFNIAEDWLDLSILTHTAIISVLGNFINGFAAYIGYSNSRVYLTGVEGSDRGLVGLELPDIVNSGPDGTPGVYGSYWQGGTISSSATQWTIDDSDGVIESSRIYQWLRDGLEIAGATSANYVATQEDVNTLLSYRVSYLDFWGNFETVTSTATSLISNVNDDPMGEPVILGTATVGSQLGVDTSGIGDIDGLGAFSYEWIRDELWQIGTEAIYTVDNSDLGSEIVVRVSYIDGFDRTEFITSDPTAPVTDTPNADLTGDVLLAGAAIEGSTLTADASGLDDTDGLGTLSYAWLRDGVSFGATGLTYELTQADVGSEISVAVSYTDGGGTNESMTSAATSAVINSNDVPNGFSESGTGLNDILEGGIGDDTLEGLGGDDVIIGNGGRDDLMGNDGDDTIFGGDGDDNIRGGDGNDSILGGEGGDFIQPGSGADTVDGEARGALNGWWNELVYIFNSRSAGATDGIIVTYTSEFGGTVTDYAGDIDTFENIDRVWGTDNADVFVGTVGRQVFAGFAGNDTIDGGEGEDWLRYDTETQDGGDRGVIVDLSLGTATDAFGDTDTLISIERIRATDLKDTLEGGIGDDTLEGLGGDDVIIGNGGNDNLVDGGGNDYLNGGADNDFIQAGRGNDTIDGGTGGVLGEFNVLSYYFTAIPDGALNGITVNYSSEFGGIVIDYDGGTDLFSNINQVWGTQNADTFLGTEGVQTFSGGAGNDRFDGGTGDDRVDYSRESNDFGAVQGITVDLAVGTATDAFGDTDTLLNIEDIRGTDLADVIFGDDDSNDLSGEGGDDFISSIGGTNNSLRGGGGNDTLNAQGNSDFVEGGDGNDLIIFTGEGGYAEPGLGSDTIIGGSEGYFSIGYHNVGEAIVADTGIGEVWFAGGDKDTLSNIRNIGGGDGNDTIIGDDDGAEQEFFSSRGNDHFDGKGGGRDWIIYDRSEEVSVTVNFATGTATGAYAGTDTFVNIEGVRGTSGADTFIGSDFVGSETTIYQGLDGVDSYQGGAGLDRLDFGFDDNRGGFNGVTVDLQLQTATDGFGNFETFSSIEEVSATDFDDVLYGNSLDNFLFGRGGSDTIDGAGGDDFVLGGLGVDYITLGAGADILSGRVQDLDGDVISDFSFQDEVYVFDDSFNLIGANLSVLGDQLLVDTDGDGIAEASMTLTNGYSGTPTSSGGDVPGTTPLVFSLKDAGVFAVATEGDSGTTDVVLTILRSGDLSATASVDIRLEGTGEFQASADDILNQINTFQTIDFAPGEVSQTYTVQIVGDQQVEPNERLTVWLSNPISESGQPAEILFEQKTVLIVNDDVEDTFRIESARNSESDTALEFTVSRTGDISGDLTLNYVMRSAGGILGAEEDDLVGGVNQTGIVTILAGENEATLAFDIAADDLPELHDNVIVSVAPAGTWPIGLVAAVREATGSIRNDDGIPPAIPLGESAASFGDPHIVTLDGLNYSFQAVGEFVLIEAISGSQLQVQVRYQPVPGSDLVSRTEAIATQVGTTRVTIDVVADDLIKVDGIPLSFADGTVELEDGQLFFDGEAVTIVYASGEQLRVEIADGFLNTTVYLAEGRMTHGLLGNADGNSANDLTMRDGTVLVQPIEFDLLYGAFADDWRITEANSLFDYLDGQSTEDFTDLSFPIGRLDLADFPETLVLQAEAVVRDAGVTDPALFAAAVLDTLVTGDSASAIAGALNAPDVATSTTAQNAPIVPKAVGISADQVEIFEGNDGTTSAYFTVYRTGDLSQGLTVDLSLTGSFSAFDLTSPSSETIQFAAFEKARTVEIGVMGDRLFEQNDTITLVLSVSDSSVRMINTSASTIIRDDDSPATAMTWIGDEQENNYTGGYGNDLLLGFAANDTLEGGNGDDTLDGGAGTDTGVYDGPQSAFTLTLSPTATTITDRRPEGLGTDTLVGMEFLDFGVEIPAMGGNPLNLEIFGGPTALGADQFSDLIELYIAYFNRAPDVMGLSFWATNYSKGQSLEEIAALFVDQDETRALYPEGSSNAFFLETVYNNVLGRESDEGGFNFWLGHLDSGAHQRDTFILNLLGGAQGSDVDYLKSKVDIGTYFSVIKGMSNGANAAEVMGLFDGSQESVGDAIAATDQFYADALDPKNGEFLMPIVGVLDDPFAIA